MARKPRILMINEFSNLNTGFSTYGKEVISRIHASGQYEIAELASYLAQDDPAQDSVDWKVFPVMPGKNSDPEYTKHYNAVRTAQFGELALNKCLMEFQPDIVFSIRDPWFDEFILRNPLRKYFKYAWMVTCDGEPQRDEWLDWYRKCDYIVTYSEWAKNMLTKEGIKVSGVFSPGTDINLYKPNKDAARQIFQIPSEWNIIQTVMRNQPRKLFPDLFHSFALFLKRCADNNQAELADNTYLHIHTSLDDVGYDIEAEIFKYGLDHKVLITYIDEKTKQPYISFYSGKRAPSQITPDGFAFTPNTVWGATKAQLANIHQIADLYVQYSICEGFGMPIVDAKACGVPTLVVPYSAMMEMGLHESGGLTTDLAALAQENRNETGQLRARPDNNVTASKFYEFFMADPAYRAELSNKAVQWVADKKLNWDDIAAQWMSLFASMDLNTLPKWTRPADIKTPAPSLPQNMAHSDFIHWAYNNILGRPELLTIAVYSQLLDQLTKGVRQGSNGNEPFTQITLAQELAGGCHNLNNLEQTRYVVCNGLNVGKSTVNVTVV